MPSAQALWTSTRFKSPQSFNMVPESVDLDYDDGLPDVDVHDPAAVLRHLHLRCDEAHANGLPFGPTERLRAFVTGPAADAFRLVLANDPPADVPPVVVHFKEGLIATSRGCRLYNPRDSEFMARFVAKLVQYGYVKRNQSATVVSHAYPVAKPNVSADAPIEQQLRFTVDYRRVNASIIPTQFPTPHPDSLISGIGDSRYFGTVDLQQGFWQLPLDESCRDAFSFVTDRGVYTPTRLMQGCTDGPGQFHGAMMRPDVLGDLVDENKCKCFIDDAMAMGRDPNVFVDNWIAMITALHAKGFKIQVKKVVFYAKAVKYCGRIYSADGVSYDPMYIEAMADMAKPTTVSELRTFLASANWMREAVPRYTEVVAPLQSLLTAAIRLLPVKPKNAAKSFLLSTVGWTQEHDAAFNAMKKALAHSVTLSYPSDSLVTCVWTDASDEFWAGVVTQTAQSELLKPVLQQSHMPMSFVSGRFVGSQLKWPTVEKEGFAILQTLVKSNRLLRRPQGFELFTDHRNLAFLFSPDADVMPTRRQAADRVERWCITLRSYKYNIQHVDGESNIVSDLMTRWGVVERLRRERAQEVALTAAPTSTALVATTRRQSARLQVPVVAAPAATSVSPAVDVSAPVELVLSPVVRESVLSTLARLAKEMLAAQPVVQPVAVSPAPVVLAVEPVVVVPEVSVVATEGVVASADLHNHRVSAVSADPSFQQDIVMQFAVEDAPSVMEILEQQHLALSGVSLPVGLSIDDSGAARTAIGQLFVPDRQHLRLRLCIVAHQGGAGHRGFATTLQSLRRFVWWPTMRVDVASFCKDCLQCLCTRGGHIIPRPLRSMVRASAPNQLIHFDFYYVRQVPDDSTHGKEQILVLLDDFSRFVECVPCDAANAAHVVTALLDWFKRFGIVHQWSSDQGSHFVNDIMTQLAERLRAEHHFTVAYAPWSNGRVERVNREIKQLMAAIMMDAQLPEDDWYYVLPNVNFLLNHTPTAVLGGLSPVTVMTGLQQSSQLEVVFQPSVGLTSFSSASLPSILAHVERMRDVIYQRHLSLISLPGRSQRVLSGEQEVDFAVGDYVLLANTTRRDKTRPTWTGPARVVSASSLDRVFTVEDLITSAHKDVHARYLKRYADSDLVITPQLLSYTAFNSRGNVIENIIDHRLVLGQWQLLIHWESEEIEEATWEPLSNIWRDAAATVRRYVRLVPASADKQRLSAVLAGFSA
jgi:transposase InsO family protein